MSSKLQGRFFLRASQLIDAESLAHISCDEEVTLPLAISSTAEVSSQVRLVFAPHGVRNRTYIHEQYVTYPFHICRVYYKPKDPPSMATLCLQSTSGGIFEADRTSIFISLKENSKAHITTAAATVAHRMENETARQNVFIEAGPGSFCEYLPGPIILFPKADLISSVDLVVDQTASVIFCDSFITHNPKKNSETFTRFGTDVCVKNFHGEVLVRDRSLLTGETFESKTPGVNGKYKAYATLMVINQLVSSESLVSVLRAGMSNLDDIYWGVSTLPSKTGIWVRMLAVDGASLRAGLDLAAKLIREFMVGSMYLSIPE